MRGMGNDKRPAGPFGPQEPIPNEAIHGDMNCAGPDLELPTKLTMGRKLRSGGKFTTHDALAHVRENLSTLGLSGVRCEAEDGDIFFHVSRNSEK